jgi:hypothetical protein
LLEIFSGGPASSLRVGHDSFVLVGSLKGACPEPAPALTCPGVRAANSLQLDETIALYAARLVGGEQHLALVNNRHPLVPLTTLRAGYRLMLHGLASETLHGFLRQAKAEAGRARQLAAATAGPPQLRSGHS